MIISHKYKFIFLKSTKTAGTSIEIALSKFCGDDDVITPLWPDEEKMRASKGYPTAQNWELPLAKHHLWHRLKIKANQTQPLFYDHVRACEVMPYIDPAIWNSYYKFAVARNPWDRVVSQYYFDFRKGAQAPLEEYLTKRKLRRINRRGWGLYTIRGKIVVDKICKYEDIESELAEAAKAIGLPDPIDLPRAKTSYRKDKPGYRDLVGKDSREKIFRAFRPEIEALGYEF